MNKEIKIGSGWLSHVLGLLFVTLKLTGVIDWSWWWVLSPFWIPVAIFVMALIIILAIGIIKSWSSK
jgi:hypothetical protein